MEKAISKFTKSFALLSLMVLVLTGTAPAQAAETAVVDVVRVIDESNPGKAGQKYVEAVKASLESQLKTYEKQVKKDKDGAQKIARKQAELSAQFQKEYARVTQKVSAELSKVIVSWLDTNKKGVTVVLPAHSVLGFKKNADISSEILARFNKVTIDFAK